MHECILSYGETGGGPTLECTYSFSGKERETTAAAASAEICFVDRVLRCLTVWHSTIPWIHFILLHCFDIGFISRPIITMAATSIHQASRWLWWWNTTFTGKQPPSAIDRTKHFDKGSSPPHSSLCLCVGVWLFCVHSDICIHCSGANALIKCSGKWQIIVKDLVLVVPQSSTVTGRILFTCSQPKQTDSYNLENKSSRLGALGDDDNDDVHPSLIVKHPTNCTTR